MAHKKKEQFESTLSDLTFKREIYESTRAEWVKLTNSLIFEQLRKVTKKKLIPS